LKLGVPSVEATRNALRLRQVDAFGVAEVAEKATRLAYDTVELEVELLSDTRMAPLTWGKSKLDFTEFACRRSTWSLSAAPVGLLPGAATRQPKAKRATVLFGDAEADVDFCGEDRAGALDLQRVEASPQLPSSDAGEL